MTRPLASTLIALVMYMLAVPVQARIFVTEVRLLASF